MYKAQQQALFQQTNQQLISIRQSEISYYTNVNLAIGTQAALIGGFAYGVFTQNQPANYTYTQACLSAYYVISSLTIACAVHVIVTTMLLQVMGPGLSLNGPIGSMAKAAEGMKAELPQVSYAFAAMMIFFAISTMLSFWVVMDTIAAILSTVVFGVASRCWYYYCRRIYHRLYWNNAEDWHNERDVDDFDVATAAKNPLQSKSTNASPDVGKVDRDNDSADETSSVKSATGTGRKIFSTRFFSKKSTATAAEDESDSESVKGNTQMSIMTGPAAIRFEGYLQKRGIALHSDMKIFGSREAASKWERRYFVLFTNGYLLYYRTRQEFRDDPKSHLKERPLELSDFSISVLNSAHNVVEDDKMSVQSSRSSRSNLGKGAGDLKILFQIDLMAKDRLSRNWSLRCDTEEELSEWSSALMDVSPASFESSASAADI